MNPPRPRESLTEAYTMAFTVSEKTSTLGIWGVNTGSYWAPDGTYEMH